MPVASSIGSEFKVNFSVATIFLSTDIDIGGGILQHSGEITSMPMQVFTTNRH